MSSGLARLVRIELRRSLGWWILPLMAVLAGFLVWNDLKTPLMLWPESVLMVRNLALFAGPILGGIAAFVAGRDRRQGVEELAATAPRPELSRKLATWTATLSWGLVAYILVGAAVLIITGLRATWGEPQLLPVLVGLLAVFAQGAVGYTAGHYLPSRFTAPLMAIGLYAAQLFPVVVTQGSPLRFLSPSAGMLQGSVWTGVQPEPVAVPQAFFMLGVGVVWLGIFALGVHRSAFCSGLLILGVVLCVSGGTAISRVAPSFEQALGPEYYEMVSHEQVCEQVGITVCVHPAYEPELGEVSRVAKQVSEPLSGITGMPDRVRQIPTYGVKKPEPQNGVVGFTLEGYSFDTYNAAYQIAEGLIRSPEDTYAYRINSAEPLPRVPDSSRKAQDAVEIWLLTRAGREVECVGDSRSVGSLSAFSPASCQAAERFTALGAEKRWEWLEQNYAELRAGELTLEDLP